MLNLAISQNSSDTAEDTSIPKYRRVYQRINAENQASNKIKILENVQFCPPSVTASTSEYFLTPKRRKVFHSDNEEGNPEIFVSPGTSSSYHVLQNAENQQLLVQNWMYTISRRQ